MTFEYLPKYIYLINILNRYMDFLSCNKDIRRYFKKKNDCILETSISSHPITHFFHNMNFK